MSGARDPLAHLSPAQRRALLAEARRLGRLAPARAPARSEPERPLDRLGRPAPSRAGWAHAEVGGPGSRAEDATDEED